jgi:CHAT domain-containing protein
MVARRNDWAQAEQFLHRALALCRRLKPDSLYEADAWHDLGQVERQAAKPELAAKALCRARDILESWRRKFQGIESVRLRWGFFFADHYRECAESLLEIGQSEKAFQAVEDGRARAFLNLLTERKLRLARMPSARAVEWLKLDAEYDRVEAKLGTRKGEESSAAKRLEGRLREIRRRKDTLLRDDRSFNHLPYPEALSLEQARQQLDLGTVLLSYSTGAEKTLLFAIASSETTVIALNLGAAELKRKVAGFRDLLIDDRSNVEEISRQGQALYDLLLRPAEPLLASGQRILISPDGPLHILPFAALVRDGRFLAEWKPIHFVLSATAYAEIKKQRRPEPDRAPIKLVAFGDPLYSRVEPEKVWVADSRTREALRRGLAPLPSTRQEVEDLASLFPGAQVYLASDATEKAVKEGVVGASLIHFAVHGVLNERVPLNSALALSLPKNPRTEKDNGLLQAWEVMENLQLDADLVTLSACDTALGGEIGGEGLIGLTRAFQYAGARSVLAALWGISDRSTADLMKHFYIALRDGKSKDEALQEAQVAQIHSAKPQPYYWAAFELFGDWK